MPRFVETINNNIWGPYLGDAQGVNSYRAAVLALLDRVNQLTESPDPSLSSPNPFVQADRWLRPFGLNPNGDQKHWYQDMRVFLNSYANNWAKQNPGHQSELDK